MAWTSSSGGAAGSRTHSRAYSARAAPARAQADTAEDKSSSRHQKTLSSASTAKRAMRPMDVPHPPRPSGDAAAAAAVTPKSTVLTGPNGRISAPPTEENRYAAAPTRSPRNQAKNRVTLGDQRPVGSSA